MVKMGTVTGSEITTNKDGVTPRLMLQVRMTSDTDIQTVEYVPLPGQDENPINGSRVYIIELNAAYKIAVGVNDGVTPDTLPGEKRLYSLDDTGAIKAFIKLLKTGIIQVNGSGKIEMAGTVIEINGDADFAVRFDALDTAIQTFVLAVNAALATKIDGVGTPGTLTLNINAAKVNEVKLP